MCWVWYVEKGTEFPNPLQALLSQYLTWSSTWKLFKPHLCGGLWRNPYIGMVTYWPLVIDSTSTPVSSPEVRAPGTKWARSMDEDQKYMRNAFSSKWPNLFFLINHSIATPCLCPGRFFPEMWKTTLPTHKAGWKGWVGIETETQPWGLTFNPWLMETGTDILMLSWLRGYHYEPCFTAFLSGSKLPSSTGFIMCL